MRRHASKFVGGALAALLAATAGCGDNSVTCGDGTHAEDGVCLPDKACGTGTIEVNGSCVPDGSVVCTQGTVFDMASGTCVLDPDACADGTTLVDGACVPDDELLMGAADHVERAEPNDGQGGVAGAFDAPALDQSTTFYGCVTATEDADGDGNLDADYDAWLVTASGPTVLEITTDGIGGLSAGFIVVSADASHPAELDSWQRIGINLTGDTAKRQVYLPAAGRYALFVTDARSLFLGDAGAGTPSTCYFSTVKRVAMPAATALTVPSQAGMDDGNVKVFTYTAPAEGAVLDLSLNTDAPALSPAFISLRGSTIHRAAAGDPPFDTVGGLASGDVVSVIVDAVYNYGVAPQAYTIDSFAPSVQPLPTDGSTITVADTNGGSPSYTDLGYQYFDVTSAGIKRFTVTGSVPLDMVILRSDIFTAGGSFDTFAQIDGFTGTGTAAFTNQYIRFLTPGRYYFTTLNPAGDNAGGTYTITSTIADVTPTAITYGTDTGSQTVAASGGFHTLDLTNPEWVEYGVTGTTDWGTGNVAIETYDLATASGWLRTGAAPATIPTGNTFPVSGSVQPAVAPFAPTGQILVGDTRDFLVRVRSTADLGAAPAYSLLVRDRAHVTLGPVMPGMPIVRTGMDNTAAGAFTRYLVLGATTDRLTAIVSPANSAVDLRLARLNADESVATAINAGGAGASELLNTPLSAGWVAFNAINAGTEGTALNLNVSAAAPLPFVDICPTGVALPAPFDGDADDDYSAVLDLPFSFPLFGVAQTQFIVAGNGFMAFGNTAPTCSLGCFSNGTIPSTTQPNGMIAPYWDDLDTVAVCTKAETDKLTVQWTGNLFNTSTTVQFQAVLHASGQVDLIYGPNQRGNGSSATVGIEAVNGTEGVQFSRNLTGSVAASTSLTYTP